MSSHCLRNSSLPCNHRCSQPRIRHDLGGSGTGVSWNSRRASSAPVLRKGYLCLNKPTAALRSSNGSGTSLSTSFLAFAVHPGPTVLGRSDLAAGRSGLAAESSDIAAGRSDLAAGRSDLAAGRSDLAADASDIAAGRSDLAADRSNPALSVHGLPDRCRRS